MEKDKGLMQARKIYYQLFSRLFVYQEDLQTYVELIGILKVLADNPLDISSKEATDRLLSKLDHSSNIKLMEEFSDIFYNPETKNVRTTASFYNEGFESGKKRVEMQRFLAKTKIRRDEEKFTEHEDSFPFLVTILAELNQLVINGEDQYTHIQHCIFDQILNEFVDEFSKSIYEHQDADLYQDVIVILKSFIEFERLYLNVSKPKPKPTIAKSATQEISEEEIKRRAKNKELKNRDNESSCPIDEIYDVEDGVD